MELEIISPGTIDKCKDIYIQLRSELLLYAHNKYNSHNYTITNENALKEAKKEIAEEVNWGLGLKLSIEELLLMEIDDAFMLKKYRTKILNKAWLDRVSQEDDQN